jgi:hypothetical protein
VTEVFGLQRLIGGTPQANLFQFAFCLVLYNLIEVVRGYVAEAQGREAATLSAEKLFEDVTDELSVWNRVIEPTTTAALFAAPPPAELQRRLRALLGAVWTERWLKAPAKKPVVTEKKRKRTHGSVYRIPAFGSAPVPKRRPAVESGVEVRRQGHNSTPLDTTRRLCRSARGTYPAACVPASQPVLNAAWKL